MKNFSFLETLEKRVNEEAQMWFDEDEDVNASSPSSEESGEQSTLEPVAAPAEKVEISEDFTKLLQQIKADPENAESKKELFIQHVLFIMAKTLGINSEQNTLDGIMQAIKQMNSEEINSIKERLNGFFDGIGTTINNTVNAELSETTEEPSETSDTDNQTEEHLDSVK